MKGTTPMTSYKMLLGLTLGIGVASAASAGGAQPQATDPGLIELTGTLSIVWGDPVGESTLRPHHSFYLTDSRGKSWELMIEEDVLQTAGGMLALNGTEVVIEGRMMSARRPSLVVERITPTKDALRDSITRDVSGSQPFIWLFFRFADNPTNPPESFDWFEEQALGQYGLDPFWREVSYNNINLTGSEVFRWWFTLEGIPSDYGIIGDTDNGDVDRGLLLEHALARAEPVVDFSPYVGIILIFNGPLDCCAWGGSVRRTIDGIDKHWGVVWAGVGGYQGHDVMTHESGHAFGLPHSSGCGVEYEDVWDLMGWGCGSCTLMDPRTNTPHGVHTNAFHKEQLGWIHPLHQYTLPAFIATAARVTLHDLAVVPPQGELLMARAILSPFAPSYYTVERRSQTGYDANLPDEVVVIHHVNETRSIPSDLVDVDGGECNDEGAMWRPGESFHDSSSGVLISVEWADEDSSGVTLTNKPRNPVYVNRTSATCEDGSPGCPWNTVSEGHAAVLPHGQVYVTPGAYPENLILGKPAVLAPSGPGSVTIGQ